MKTSLMAAAFAMLAVLFVGRAEAMYLQDVGLYDYAAITSQHRSFLESGVRHHYAGGMQVSGRIVRDQYADGMNLYQYVRSGPTRYRDPSGLLCLDLTIELSPNSSWLDRNIFLPFGTYYASSVQDAIDKINRRQVLAGDRFHTPLKYSPDAGCSDTGCYCFERIRISSHGSSGSIDLDDVSTLTKGSFHLANAGQTGPEIRLLQAMKSKLCKNGVAEFVSCYSATLKEPLEDYFGSDVRVVTYCKKVVWSWTGPKETD